MKLLKKATPPCTPTRKACCPPKAAENDVRAAGAVCVPTWAPTPRASTSSGSFVSVGDACDSAMHSPARHTSPPAHGGLHSLTHLPSGEQR